MPKTFCHKDNWFPTPAGNALCLKRTGFCFICWGLGATSAYCFVFDFCLPIILPLFVAAFLLLFWTNNDLYMSNSDGLIHKV